MRRLGPVGWVPVVRAVLRAGTGRVLDPHPVSGEAQLHERGGVAREPGRGPIARHPL
jgi:hypothetical protein